MRYAGLIKDDVNNGVGVGLTLFTQGCPHHCKGCQNPETWDFNGGKEYTEEIYNEIIEYFMNNSYATRLTLSGGDPLYSPRIILPLCEKIKEIRPDVKIWLYTGHLFEDIKDKPIIKLLDVVVDGPFILEERDITLPFRGSRNQRLIDVKKTLEENKINILVDNFSENMI